MVDLMSNLGITTASMTGIMDVMGIVVMLFFFMIIMGGVIYLLWDWLRYNVQVELVRQVGQPFYDEKGNKVINIESQLKPAMIYDKKLKNNVAQERFKIKGTNFDSLNYFQDELFYVKKQSHPLDFQRKGIKLFIDPIRGLVPIMLSNPGMKVSEITLNEVLGATVDSLSQTDELYNKTDFWSKYGGVIQMMTFIIGIVLIIMFLTQFMKTNWEEGAKFASAAIQARGTPLP